MLFVTILVGVAVWAALDTVQSRRLRDMFEADLWQRLQKHVHQDRIRFDNYVASYNQAAKLMVSQHSFRHYVANRLQPGSSSPVAFHRDLPAWLPDAAVMRKFTYINFGLLIDERGLVREVYQAQPAAPPASLLRSSKLHRQLSRNQSFLTEIDGKPFLLTSESLPGSKGATASLMLAAQLDDEFLMSSKRDAGFEGEIEVLAGGEEPRIVASNRPDIVPAGAKLSDLRNDYLIIGKSFFDSGASDLLLQLTTLISKREFRKLNDAIMTAERLQRAIVALALIAAFAFIIYCITRRIRRLTDTITDLSQHRLNLEPARRVERGDELCGLEDQFRHFTDEILESHERLEQSNRQLHEFTYIASHDLQEPLRKIVAFSDRLKADTAGIPDDRSRDYLKRIQNAATRMQTLVNDLLIYSRVTTRAEPFVPVNLATVVKEVLSDLEISIEQTGGRVEIGSLPTVEADALQMRQLFQNLIGNALKFHRIQEPPFVQVTSCIINAERKKSVGNDGELCRITVVDNGIGFEEKHGDLIFGVFQRLHGRSEYEGTGIGLAICKKIAARHAGSISAKSSPGNGATFIVTLPLKQVRG